MSRANRSRATHFLGQELEFSLGAAVPRTDFRVATCQVNALDHSSKETPKPLPLVEGVGLRALGHTRVKSGRLCQRILGRSSRRILDSQDVHITSRRVAPRPGPRCWSQLTCDSWF